MTLLVPVMLFGWVPLTVVFFFRMKPHRAVLFSVIGGVLFLPMAGYNLPGLPPYNKSTAIALGLLLGGRLSGARSAATFKWRIYDLPMILWCLCPIVTSLSNQLGFYDGLAGLFGRCVTWGIPYLAGRIYFNTPEAMRDLALGIVVGGLVYALLCLYEIRMSPRLSKDIYGFFPHDWRQHKRYGGWRPIVFMQHGLMVALWMAVSSSIAFWLWRSRQLLRLSGLPIGFVVALLIVTTILCKSGNGWFTLALGCGGYFVYRSSGTRRFLVLLLLSVPLYMGLRITGVVSAHTVETVAARLFFDAERVGSLGLRLLQEDLFIQRALQSPLFGWGGYSRGWPVDPETGRKLIRMVDALWIIVFSKNGFLGLTTFTISMLTGPWLILRSMQKNVQKQDILTLGMIPVVLSLVVILFMIDSLFNGMVNSVYIMCSGALVGYYWVTIQRKKCKSSKKRLDRGFLPKSGI